MGVSGGVQVGANSLEPIRKHCRCEGGRLEHARYMPGLDGLRALAVFAVIAYHLNVKWAPDGLLGVGLFFVLSGYLITDLLTAQWSLSGGIDLKDFWLRRARRLLPALFAMLAGVVVWSAFFSPSRLAMLWGDVLSAVFYVSNWWFIFHHVSYFARFGPPSPLGHLWSLAVEEQFYLVWPLLLWLGLRYVPRRSGLVGLTLAGALASALAMALIYQPGTDPSRVYYGTDTRVFALLIGAALALVWPSRQLSATLAPKARLVLDLVGGAGLLIVLLMIWQTNEYETFLYRGGLLLFSLTAAILVAVLAHPASRLGRLFSRQPLRWLGQRSYAVYLWHYPVIVLTSSAVNTGGVDIFRAICQVAASIALAALSWRFIEEPIRHGAGERRRHRRRAGRQRGLVPSNGWITAGAALLVLVVSCLTILVMIFITNKAEFAKARPGSPAPTGERSLRPEPSKIALAEAGVPGGGRGANSGMTPSGLGTGAGTGTDTRTPAAKSGAAATVTPQAGKGVTVIGDSVMVGAEPALKELLPGLVVSAQVGRQLYQASSVVEQLRAQGELGKRVVIELGTNGPFTAEQLVSLLQSLGKVQQIVLVNTRVPRPWEGVVNQTLAQVAATYPHTTLVDWYSASSGHNAYFYPDGVHLDPTGLKVYASLVAKAIDSQELPQG